MDRLPPAELADPFEPTNRTIYRLNNDINTAIIFPLAKGYATVVPPPARTGISNGIANLNEPTVLINNVLQGRFKAASITLRRFVINSTLGIAGLFDLASRNGLPQQTGDFGQTMFVWGWTESPYVMVPLLGPTTIRDGIGYGIDSAASPTYYAIYEFGGPIPTYGIGGFDAIARVKELQAVDETSIDSYVRLRSLYYQTRRTELLDGIGKKDDVFQPTLYDGAIVDDVAPSLYETPLPDGQAPAPTEAAPAPEDGVSDDVAPEPPAPTSAEGKAAKEVLSLR